MRIGFFIWGVNGFGGAERVMVCLCNSFAQKGYSVTLFMTAGDPRSDVYPLRDDVRICCPGSDHACGRIKKYDLLRREIKCFKPDVIISFEHIVNVVAILLGGVNHVPVIVSERSIPNSISKLSRFLMKCTYWHASYLVVQTNEIKQLMKRYCRRRVIIQNPVDPHVNEKKSYMAECKIVAVGRLVQVKNYELLLEAFREFHQEHTEYLLDIYGDGVLKNKMKNRICEMGLECIVNLKGNQTNVVDQLKNYDFYVITSNYEGQPNSLLEAMAVGLPCICTQFDGGGAAVICNQYNGICIEKGNREQLVKAMNELAVSEKKREKYGRNAKKVVDKYGIEPVINKWESYVKRCVGYNGYVN